MAMKRKVRISEDFDSGHHYNFKDDIIKDILYQIDYQAAYRNKVVSVSEKDMIKELRKLSTGVLISWYKFLRKMDFASSTQFVFSSRRFSSN